MPGDDDATLLSRIARPWVAAVGIVASIVQLATAPWPLAIRLAILGLLVVAALLMIAYHSGQRRATASGHHTGGDLPRTRGSSWADVSLEGCQVVKVASRSKNVALCEFHEPGNLFEQWLPLSPAAATEDTKFWRGKWMVDDDGLRIIVRGYHLMLARGRLGVLTGDEHYGEDTEPFVGGVVESRPIRPGEAWLGLKLGERGVRRVVYADGGGRVTELDPFAPSFVNQGTWELDDELRILVGGWSLAATEWRPGIYLGVEHSDESDQGFAVVRIHDWRTRTSE